TGNTTQGSSSGSYQEIRGLNQFPPGLLTRPGASATYSPQQGTEQVSITKDAAIVSVREGARLEALVLRPSAEIQHYVPPSASQSAVSPSPVTLSGVPQIPSGSALQVHVLATEIPKITVGSLPPVTSGGDQFQTPPASSSVALPAGTPAGLTPGAEITSQRVLLPQVQAASSQPAFTATVVGTERSGEIVLQSPLGTLKLPADSTLPQGSRLLLEVTSLSAKPASIPLLPLADSDTLQLVAGLKGAEGATQALLQTLQQLDTELGGAQVKQQFPATDQFLAARALWFMHAAITGQAEHWVHPETRKLLEHYQRPDLIQKLDQDFQTMQHLARTPNADGWQTLMFPVVDGNNVHYITFYNRQQKRRHKDTGEEEGTDWRFIVELTLQHLGAVQFDGLYHNADGARSLDLYIRSSERFPQEMQREILAIYNAEMELAGVDGSLQFVAGEAFPMHPGYPTHPVGEGSILA
ncbi:MAG: hypothetical protein KDD76_06160, partial [Rickettsiales bacterium]|nr:hypothetical protein [Rickettsiales bacterium]